MSYLQVSSAGSSLTSPVLTTRHKPRRRAVDVASEKKKENERKLMEELADVEILEDTLNKSMNLAEQMDDTLRSFEQRLQNFEKTILPIHKSTQRLNRFYESKR
ncbi:hypothetical protein HMI54_005244 [Coelomomyces lativittatus]|nr:hypothetical protein HMI54_005244 [Coelomomyces lativittatus]